MSKCRFCKIINRCGKTIKIEDSVYVLIHRPKEQWIFAHTAPQNQFFKIKIKYCPMCGRKLKKKEKV